MGKVAAKRAGSVRHPHAICGVSDDVAHVSMMSFSPMKPPGTPRFDSSKPGAASDDGSTGSAVLAREDGGVPHGVAS